jgi:hypothetical protein
VFSVGTVENVMRIDELVESWSRGGVGGLPQVARTTRPMER